MGKLGKYWLIGVIGVLLIVLLAFAATGDGRDIDNGGNAQSGAGAEQTGGTESGMDGSFENSSQGTADNTDSAGNKEALDSYLKEQDVIMAEMMQDMEDIPETGNASLDFLYGMIPHHESALAMAESYLKYGGANEDLKKVADDVIKVQEVEIEQMKEMIKRIEAGGTKDEAKADKYREEYAKLFSSHAHMHSSASNVERAFAEGMIMHHQMAVDMAESILNYTDDEELEKLSRAIIEAQEKEIDEMQRIAGEMQS